MTTDEWTAAVMRGCIAQADALPEDVRPVEFEGGEFSDGKMLGMAWRWNGGRYGRKFAMPQAEHLRNEITAEYVATATIAQWLETCAELQAKAA